MINITSEAQNKLEEHLKNNKLNSAIRIFIESDCSGAENLSLTLSEAHDTDLSHDSGALKLIIDSELSKKIGKATIDFVAEDQFSGFVVEAENFVSSEDSNDCGSCTSCC